MNSIIPLVGTCFYLTASQFLREKFRDPVNQKLVEKPLHYFSILHNAALALFSGYTCWSLCSVLWKQGIIHGHNIYMSQPFIKSVIYLFYMSKYYEYIDTFLIYMKGRNPIFLQKYHHVGAAICWYLCYEYNVDMIIFGTILNSGVHSVMYSYYLMTLLKWNVRGIRMYITSGQMVQLITGASYGIYYYYPPVETTSNYWIIIFFNVYIYGLIYLFGQFMVDNYQSTKKV
jgi:GNS1/SUR4 family